MNQNCQQCGEAFEAKRSDARYCSNNCKVKYHRRRSQIKEEFEQKKQEHEQATDNRNELAQKLHLQINQTNEKLTQELRAIHGEKNALRDELKQELETKDFIKSEINDLQAIISLDDEEFHRRFIMRDKRIPDGIFKNHYFKTNPNCQLFIKEQRAPYAQEQNENLRALESVNERIEFIKEQLNTEPPIMRHIAAQIKANIDRLKELDAALIPTPQVAPALVAPSSQLPPIKSNRPKDSAVDGSDLATMEFNTFKLQGQLGSFLGNLDRNKLAFALTGESGAGKSWFSFALTRLFTDAGYTCKYFALEEGIGALLQEKVVQYRLDDSSVKFEGEGKLKEVRKAAGQYDLIVVDSFSKLDAKPDDFEKLRTDFPNTLFIIIFQQTDKGTMRGGSSIKFNSAATINVCFQDGERVAVMQKGRYGTMGWVYSIEQQCVISHGQNR